MPGSIRRAGAPSGARSLLGGKRSNRSTGRGATDETHPHGRKRHDQRATGHDYDVSYTLDPGGAPRPCPGGLDRGARPASGPDGQITPRIERPGRGSVVKTVRNVPRDGTRSPTFVRIESATADQPRTPIIKL